jgi:hypothetical protein
MLLGCKKEEPVAPLTECQKENVGYMAFQNKSNDAYDVWINNEYYRQIPANSHETVFKKYPAGKVYRIKVQQVAGYVVNPTVKNFEITLNQCDEKQIHFP